MSKDTYPDPVEARFWSKVDASGDCWEWAAGRTTTGYGSYSVWVDGRVQANYAHRFAYQALVGDVPAGLQLDHLCRNPLCVNPDHLEPVTCAENLRRSPQTHSGKTHCVHGHPYDETNTYVYVQKGQRRRRCRECFRLYSAGYAPRRRARARKEAAGRTTA